MFKRNSTLKKIDLSRSHVGVDGSIALADGLKENSSLTKMDISRCSIDDDGMAALTVVLDTNYWLSGLGVCYHGAMTETVGKFVDVMKRNDALAASGRSVKAARGD